MKADPFLALFLCLACLYCLWWSLALTRRLRRLEEASTIDPLTGLRSGRFFQAERWHAALRSDKPLTVAYVDLDGLKPVNDTAGHAAGDALIRRAAEALRSVCRRGVDEVFRMHTAGDEFVILQHGSPRSAEDFAEALRSTLRWHTVRASVGVVRCAVSRYELRRDALDRAEALCRAAKRRGGDCALAETLPSPAHEASDGIPHWVSDSSTPLAREMSGGVL